MGKKIKFGDIFQPGDILAALVVIAGIMIAIFLGDLALKLIGVSIAILGALALVMLVSQRLSDVVESNKFNLPQQPYDFKMTVVKDSAAKRQTIENFEASFGSEIDINQANQVTMGTDEGFRIVSKSTRAAAAKADDSTSPAKNIAQVDEPEQRHNATITAKELTADEPEKHTIHIPEQKNTLHVEHPAVVSEPQAEELPEEPAVAEELFASKAEELFVPLEAQPQDAPAPEIEMSPNKNVAHSISEPKLIITPEYIPEIEENTPEEFELEIEESEIVEPEVFEEEMIIEEIPEPEIEIPEMIEPEAFEEEMIIDDIIEAEIELPETFEPEVFEEEMIIDDIIEAEIELPEMVVPEASEEEITIEEVIDEIEHARAFIPEQEQVQAKETVSPIPVAEPEPKEPCKKKQMDMPFSLLMEDEPALGQEPRKEFEFFISRVLLIIRSVINTRTAAFILVNSENNQLILESYVTSIPDSITTEVKIPMGNDVVSQIINSAKPEILTEINPSAELDLIPYYSSPAGTSSFIGLPIFFEKQVVGIISCDTNEKNAYDASTVSFLGHFSKLISGLVQSYTEKYDLLQADKTLKALNRFGTVAEQFGTDHSGISQALVEMILEMYEVHTAGVCLYDDQRNGWYITAFNSFNDFPKYLQNEPIVLDKTLIGDAIINSTSILEMPIVSKKPRVSPKEMSMPGGYFICVPIKSELNTFGALYLEGASHSSLNNIDMNILETIAKSAGSNIEKMNLIKMLQTGSVIDPDTGLMNAVGFFRRLQEEIARVRDYKSTVSLCLISIDKYAAFESDHAAENLEQINYHCINLINKNLHEYDVFGKVDTGVFALVLIGQSADKAKLWAERIRNSAAISVIEVEHRRFTVTLSIGVSQISPADDINILLENCSKVLNIAANKTNSVQVYQ